MEIEKEIIRKLDERLTELKQIYKESGKTDYDAGRVQGMIEALEIIQGE